MPTPEDRIPAPLSPYGASKWAAEAYVNTWSSRRRRAPRGLPARQRLRPAPKPPRRGRRGRDLQPPPARGQAPTLYGQGRPPVTTSTSRTSCAPCSPPPGRRGTFNVATGVETDVRASGGTARGRRARARARARGPAPGRAAAQLPRHLPRRARARLAGRGPDRRGPAPDLRGAGGGVRRQLASTSRRDSSAGRARLKIVVSPVRVRVSPSGMVWVTAK